MNNRGVSESIGFVLVFALVTALIGMTYATGFGGLLQTQNAEQLANMERAFDVLDDNLESIHQEGAASRATEMKLAGGTLLMENSIRLEINSSSNEPELCNATRPVTLSPRPLVYESGDSRVVYSNGAVFRTDGNDSVMLSKPDWLINNDRAVLSFVTTRRSSFQDTGGDTTVLVVASQRSQRLQCAIDNSAPPNEVSIIIDSPRAVAWERFFEDEGFETTRISETEVEATFTTNTLYVADTSIDISLET